MKIIYVLPSLRVSNATAIYEQAQRLEQRNHEILITSLNDPEPVEFYPLTIKRKKLADCVKDFEKADVIIATNTVTAFYVNDLDTQAKKFFQILNNELNLYNKEIFKMKYPKLDKDRLNIELKTQQNYLEASYQLPLKYLVPNKKLMSILEQYEQKPYLVPIAVNTDYFYPDKAILKGDKIRITVEGNPLPWKGIKDLNRALSDLRDFELWVITDSKPGFIKADKYWKTPDIGGIRKILSSSDIFIRPYHYDDIADYQIEAMACGCPVITTKTAGSKMFCTKKNSVMIKSGDYKELAKAIKDLMKDKNKRESLIKEGLKTAKNLKWKKSIDCLESALKGRRKKYE